MSRTSECFIEVSRHRETDASIYYLKVHMTTRWTNRHGLMLFLFEDLMNVTEKLQFIDPMFRHSCLVPSSGMIYDLDAKTRDPFIRSLT